MDINEVKTLARTTMDTHGLKQWKLVMIRSKSFAGMCKTRRWDLNPELSTGTIELSIDYMEVFDRAHALNIILHEIAHALDEPRYADIKTKNGTRKRGLHHDATWKAIAKRIGCTGERCVSHDAPKIKSRYVGICKNGHEVARHRLTDSAKTNSSCPKCSKKFSRDHMFDWYDNGRLVHQNTQKPAVKPQKTVEVVTQKPKPPAPAQGQYSFDSDDLTPEQLRILKGLLTKA